MNFKLIFSNVTFRDEWLGRMYPHRKAMSAPGLFQIGNSYRLTVFMETVTVFKA